MAPASEPVREQIKGMIAPGNDDDFAKSLPESTQASASDVEAPRRKRRSKEEMAAARGGSQPTQPEVDPLMSDPRYAKIMSRMSGVGGKKIIGFGFKASGKPLSSDEETEIDDQFYIMAKKGGWNPAQSWVAIIIYFFFAVLGPMIAERTELGDKLKELFRPLPQPPKKDETGEVAMPAGALHLDGEGYAR